MKTYDTHTASTQKQREASLRSATEKTANGKKEIAKILVAMITAGDCAPGKILKHAEEITGKNLRTNLQGVYELMGIFQAIIDKKIDLTEDDFEAMESSKLALLLPFVNKPELTEKLGEAIEAAKNGTAADIRKLKPTAEKKEPKAVTELKAEIERLKAENSRQTTGPGTPITSALIVTDIPETAAILTSRQVLNRIRKDAENFANDNEVMPVMIDKLARALVMACALYEADGNEVVSGIYAELAAMANGQEATPVVTIEAQAA